VKQIYETCIKIFEDRGIERASVYVAEFKDGKLKSAKGGIFKVRRWKYGETPTQKD